MQERELARGGFTRERFTRWKRSFQEREVVSRERERKVVAREVLFRERGRFEREVVSRERERERERSFRFVSRERDGETLFEREVAREVVQGRSRERERVETVEQSSRGSCHLRLTSCNAGSAAAVSSSNS